MTCRCSQLDLRLLVNTFGRASCFASPPVLLRDFSNLLTLYRLDVARYHRQPSQFVKSVGLKNGRLGGLQEPEEVGNAGGHTLNSLCSSLLSENDPALYFERLLKLRTGLMQSDDVSSATIYNLLSWI